MCYKHGRKEVIRPEKVRAAARYLTQTELFREHNIAYDESWGNDVSMDETVVDTECTCEMENQFEQMPVNPGNTETLLDTEQDVIIMALGEGKRPIVYLMINI